jgi:hypothetical protein
VWGQFRLSKTSNVTYIGVMHNFGQMRVTIILILTFFYVTAWGQRLTKKYQDRFGHTLVLKNDSTFRFDWRFDLVHNWTTGQWTLSGRTINLKFIDVYDTLSRPNKPDSLVLSIDEKSNKIIEGEFGQTRLVSGRQYKDRFDDKFYQRGKRLYPIDNNGRPIKTRQRGIWAQKKWWGYKTWPIYYKRSS